jgi:hypothetical protein
MEFEKIKPPSINDAVYKSKFDACFFEFLGHGLIYAKELEIGVAKEGVCLVGYVGGGGWSLYL